MLRLRDVFDIARWHDQGIVSFNMKAVGVLGVLLADGAADDHRVHRRSRCCCRAAAPDLDGAGPYLLYFAAIGLGFMLIEISQLQRLTIFLGHPAYSLSVVLFSLLVSSGLGSLSTGRADGRRWRRSGRRGSVLTIVVLLAFGFLTPVVAHQFESSSTPVRIALAIAVLCPVGFCMGMAFPLGMRLALGRAPLLAPWFWGVNGAASVCASVLAVVIAIGAGISAAFWTGDGVLSVALLALAWPRVRFCQPSAQD